MLLQNTPHHIAVWAVAGTGIRPKHYVYSARARARVCVCVCVCVCGSTFTTDKNSRTLELVTVWVHRQFLTFSFWRLPKNFDHLLPCQLL